MKDNITIKRYFELLRVYGENVMNEAKNELRNIVQDLMTKAWMHEEAQGRAFKGQKIEQKKAVFYKYMYNFREEIKAGEIEPLINRAHVLSIPLFHQ